MQLETVTGNLIDGYKQLQPGTMLHVDELMNERRNNPDLRNRWFYTADGEVYFLDSAHKNPTLAITREAHNPVLQNINDAFEQLNAQGNYRVMFQDYKRAISAPDTFIVDLTELCLSDSDSENWSLNIGTAPSKYAQLNDAERKLAERIYGQGENFVKNMKMLENIDIPEVKIYVLNPDYVRKHAERGAIGRASWLKVFEDISDFFVMDRGICGRSSIRGIRKKIDENNHLTIRAPTRRRNKQISSFRTFAEDEFIAYYDAILADPESAVKALDGKTAAGLLELVSKYFNTR